VLSNNSTNRSLSISSTISFVCATRRYESMWKFAMEIPRVQEKVPGHGAYAANSFLALGDVGLEGLREREGAITTIQCQHYN
jgi:hypothetical protein